jgi:hypothetical protein
VRVLCAHKQGVGRRLCALSVQKQLIGDRGIRDSNSHVDRKWLVFLGVRLDLS